MKYYLLNHLDWLPNILRRLFAETAGFLVSEPPISKVFSKIGIFYLFEKCLSFDFSSPVCMLDMLFGFGMLPMETLNFFLSSEGA